MIETVARFKKKYTLALLLFVAGSALAFQSGASLTEYTIFTATVLSIFGISDVADKQVTKK